MNRFTLRQSLLLLLTSMIWGAAFVAQSVGMDYIGPFTFNAARNLIGAAVLLPCIAFLKMGSGAKPEPSHDTPEGKKTLFAGGIACGVLLFAASNLQQIGMQDTTVGKAGFVTAMYIVLVPAFGVFLKKRVGMKVWGAIALAVAGLYLLCMTGDSAALQKGDLLILCCAGVFSLHILTVDHYSPKVDGVKMSCIQFFVCGVLSGICMLLFETPDISRILQAWAPILYAGVLSCGVAYTLQIVGQKGVNPAVASLILSMESVFSVIAGWLVLGQTLSGREMGGCALMFAAILLAQLPDRKKAGEGNGTIP